MALLLNEEQGMLRDSARDWLAANAPVSHLRALRDEAHPEGFSRELWAGFANMGFAGVLVPESHGGLELGCVEAGVLMEEIGRRLVPSPLLSTGILAAGLIRDAGSAEQRDAWLPRIVAGQVVLALAVDENPRHRPERIALGARALGGGLRLNGTKCFVVDGHVADAWLVAARTRGTPGDTDGITLLLVPRDTPGVTVERTHMVDSHNAARLTFDDAPVPASARLGGDGQGWPLLSTALERGRAALAAELLGVAEEAFARTLQYLAERRQFGRLIGEFQALQHRAAHLYCEIEITRAAVLAALQALDAGDAASAAQAVAVAKARACASATLAVQEAVQMHGGIGMTDALDIGLFMKRARVASELFGDDDFHADRLARMRGY